VIDESGITRHNMRRFFPPLKMRRVAKNLQCKTTRKKSRGYNTLTTRGRATPSNSERNQIN